ncbi:MAG: phospho-N-acetylmuramoyl-pentapeptide-transferase [bacterium]|nr:phospho-N-acetylmuramoyl-pentapeptide-transferase [bacterium]
MPIFHVSRILGLSMVSFLVALILTPIIIKLLKRIKAAKQIRSEESAPIFYRLHKSKENTPTMGGIIIWTTIIGLALIIFLLSWLFGGFWTYLNFINRAETYLPLAAMFGAAILGLADDFLGVLRKGANGGGLRMYQKLIMYSVIAVLGALWFYFKLDWNVLYIPFLGNLYIGWWYIPIFTFIIVASAFSANETDGLDGLAGGVMLFAFMALTAVAFVLGRYDLAVFGGVTIGALLAFLWNNIYPARFFMGDTGSMSLGITMGVIAMLTNTAIFLPFFASILVLESLSVIIQVFSKKLRGKKVFLSAPIHHHFEALGWPETKVTMRFWIISVIFGLIGLVLFFVSQLF